MAKNVNDILSKLEGYVKKYPEDYHIDLDKDKDFSEIYLIVGPTGVYVGQAQLVYIGLNGRRNRIGTFGRFLSHISDAQAAVKQGTSGNCTHLNNALIKYGWRMFEVMPLARARTGKEANELEAHYIRFYRSKQNCYNICEGGKNGKASEEKRRRMSESISGEKHPYFNKTHTSYTRAAISHSLTKHVERLGHRGQFLPQYIKWTPSRKAYQIMSHPRMQCYDFGGNKLSNDEKLELCMKAVEICNDHWEADQRRAKEEGKNIEHIPCSGNENKANKYDDTRADRLPEEITYKKRERYDLIEEAKKSMKILKTKLDDFKSKMYAERCIIGNHTETYKSTNEDYTDKDTEEINEDDTDIEDLSKQFMMSAVV